MKHKLIAAAAFVAVVTLGGFGSLGAASAWSDWRWDESSGQWVNTTAWMETPVAATGTPSGGAGAGTVSGDTARNDAWNNWIDNGTVTNNGTVSNNGTWDDAAMVNEFANAWGLDPNDVWAFVDGTGMNVNNDWSNNMDPRINNAVAARQISQNQADWMNNWANTRNVRSCCTNSTTTVKVKHTVKQSQPRHLDDEDDNDHVRTVSHKTTKKSNKHHTSIHRTTVKHTVRHDDDD